MMWMITMAMVIGEALGVLVRVYRILE